MAIEKDQLSDPAGAEQPQHASESTAPSTPDGAVADLTTTPTQTRTNVAPPAIESPTAGPGVSTEVVPDQLSGEVTETPVDRTRRDLAFRLLWILVLCIILSGALIVLTPVLHLSGERVSSFVQLVLTTLATIVATVFGFYFASKRQD